jgi:hypothetical protein
MKYPIKLIICLSLLITPHISQAEVLAKYFHRDQVWRLSDEVCPEGAENKKATITVPMLTGEQTLGACWALDEEDPNIVAMCRTANNKILSDCLYVNRSQLHRP